MAPLTSKALLSVDIQRKAFAGEAEIVVLDRIAFDVGAREIVAIVGPSGCGKTTLLRIVGGLDTAFTGTVAWSAPLRIGTVFQEPRLLPWRTVRQNLVLALPPDASEEEGDELLRRLGLWPSRDIWASKLSLGMARRLALARALAARPGVLLLDEPFVSLDEAMVSDVRRLLLDVLQTRPTAVLLVTHDLEEAVSLAGRVLLFSSAPARLLHDVRIPEGVCCAATTVAEVASDLRRLINDAKAADC